MKLRIFYIIILTLIAFATKAQVKIDTLAKAVYVDNLDNIYLLSPKEEILKYNSAGKLKWRYSNNRYGKLQNIDVSDPLRTLLFYGDFQQVVVLNNNLNEISTYSFASNGNRLISAIASSNNNGFWAFDRSSNSLLKLSSNFIEDMRSANLYQLFDRVVIPKKLVASDQSVYLQETNNQILQFDQFGAFVKPLPIDSLTDFNITLNKIAYWSKGAIILFDPLTSSNTKLSLNVPASVQQIAIGNKIIAVLTEKAVFLYPYKTIP